MKSKIIVLTVLAAVLFCGCSQNGKPSASEYDGLLVYTTVGYSDYSEDYKAYAYKNGRLTESGDFSGLKQCLNITNTDGGFPETDNPGINKSSHISLVTKRTESITRRIFILRAANISFL